MKRTLRRLLAEEAGWSVDYFKAVRKELNVLREALEWADRSRPWALESSLRGSSRVCQRRSASLTESAMRPILRHCCNVSRSFTENYRKCTKTRNSKNCTRKTNGWNPRTLFEQVSMIIQKSSFIRVLPSCSVPSLNFHRCP